MKLYKTSQGRSSLLLAINAFARKDRKFIITQAFTCIAVPEAIFKSGYVPFWIDIELKTYSLNIELLKDSINKYEDSFAAIIIQHTYGILPKDYEELKLLASNYKIPIIEDRCHCNFVNDYIKLKSSKIKEKIAFCYSFENAKPIKLGRGGLLIISNEDTKENNNLNKIYEKFENQSFLQSFQNIFIAIIYIITCNTFLYWPLLGIYRYFARKGIFPSNFRLLMKDLKYEKMGIFQSSILKILNILIEFNSKGKSKFIFFNPISLIVNHLRIIKISPYYVKNKKHALEYCKKNGINALQYFNTPIPPLNSINFKIVNYRYNLCPNAEKASEHIIVINNKLSHKLTSKIMNL